MEYANICQIDLFVIDERLKNFGKECLYHFLAFPLVAANFIDEALGKFGFCQSHFGEARSPEV